MTRRKKERKKKRSRKSRKSVWERVCVRSAQITDYSTSVMRGQGGKQNQISLSNRIQEVLDTGYYASSSSSFLYLYYLRAFSLCKKTLPLPPPSQICKKILQYCCSGFENHDHHLVYVFIFIFWTLSLIDFLQKCKCFPKVINKSSILSMF